MKKKTKRKKCLRRKLRKKVEAMLLAKTEAKLSGVRTRQIFWRAKSTPIFEIGKAQPVDWAAQAAESREWDERVEKAMKKLELG
jgi:hypothetical protein